MNVRSAIQRAVPILAERGQLDRDMLLPWLIRGGLSKADAHDAIRFIPLAFGRALLAGMGVDLPDTYIRVSAAGREEIALQNEPFFHETLAMIPQFGGDAMGAIAPQSPEVSAINQALHAGAQPEYLVASPPLIECDFPPRRRERPWWRFRE
jgi:hypothetical protein